MKMKKRFLGILLSLVLVLGLIPGMSLTAYAGTSDTGIEVLIADIDCEDYKDKTTSFTTDDGLANISFSATPTFDDAYGWYNPNDDLTIKVTAANEDYPISKCVFQCFSEGREDSTDPFEVTISYGGNWNNTTATINDVSESSRGLKHIGIFSRITPDHTVLEDGMLIKPGESIIPGDYYYKTAGYVNTDNPDKADFKKNTLYTLVKGNIESRQVDPSYPDWVEDVFVESNDGDHYAFLQVANGKYIFDGSWEVTNHADGLLVSQGTSENMNNPEERITTYAFSVHEKVFNDVMVDNTIENGSIEVKDSEGTAISEAEAGSTVTLDVSADEGYKLKEISAYYLEVQSVSELMELIGSGKCYENPSNLEESNYFEVVDNSIKVFSWTQREYLYSLPSSVELDKTRSSEGIYTAIGTYDDAPLTWIFKVKKGKIISIGFERNGVDGGIVNIESTGTITEPTYASVKLTPVTTGEQYTFKMPATDVTVNAVFAEKHTHDGIDFTAWDNATGLPEQAGNYYLTQDVTLSETWTVPGTNNLCLNGHSINGPTNASSVFNVNTNTTLNLYDCGVTAGTIIARYKNGVTVAPGSTFNLYGGKITSNTDNQAIGVENFGTFNMYGGEISGNKDTGVSNVDGTFTMTGGTIRDNGKGVANQDIFKLSGNPTITNNKSGTGDSAKDNNVSLANNKVITIDGVLSNITPIGVTMSAPGVFTSGWNDKMSDKTPTDYFTSDDSAYTVQVDGNELKLAVIKTNPTVTAPTAKSLTYTGSAQELVNAGSTNDGTLYYAVTTENTAPTDDNLYTTSIPTGTDAGTYYVWYMVKGDNNHNDTKAASVKVSIAKRRVTLTSGTATKVYDGKALKNNKVTVSGDGWAKGEGATYKVTGSQTKVGKSNNKFSYTLKSGTDAKNYNIVTKTGTLTVTEPVVRGTFIHIKSITQKNNKLQINWTKVGQADGYDVYVQYCAKKYADPVKTIKKNTTTQLTIAKLNDTKIDLTKAFKIYVSAYKTVNGKKTVLAKTVTSHVVGVKNAKYTNQKALKLTKSAFDIKAGKTAKIKVSATLVDGKKKIIPQDHGAAFKFRSSNTHVATVDKDGKITAKTTGTCYIFVYGISGLMKKVTVTVK